MINIIVPKIPIYLYPYPITASSPSIETKTDTIIAKADDE